MARHHHIVLTEKDLAEAGINPDQDDQAMIKRKFEAWAKKTGLIGEELTLESLIQN
jgi:hypothetical protein